MRSDRQRLFVAALVLASVWTYLIASSGIKLLTLFDGFDDATVDARVVVDREPREPLPATEEPPQVVNRDTEALAAPTAAPTRGLSPQQIPTGDLSPAQIKQLIANELASDTDPLTADEFLQAFKESLDVTGR